MDNGSRIKDGGIRKLLAVFKFMRKKLYLPSQFT